MPLLYYWRGDNYRRDLDYGAGYHLNQNNPRLHAIDIGDSLWAFTRTKAGRYVLAAELVVRAKTHNAPRFRYGKYRLWGDLRKSRYFATSEQLSVEQVLRQLSIKARADILGKSFQGHAAVRSLSKQDHRLLTQIAADLPLEPRARLLPEERLEASILLGDPEAVYHLVKTEPAGLREERAAYLYSEAPKRNPSLIRELRELYAGRCQICTWAPRSVYAVDICEGHHLHWLSRGGADELVNLALLCPNHHRAVHARDAAFDYLDLGFDFGTWKELITLNDHLPSVAARTAT